jgi:hypothetical protein
VIRKSNVIKEIASTFHHKSKPTKAYLESEAQ